MRHKPDDTTSSRVASFSRVGGNGVMTHRRNQKAAALSVPLGIVLVGVGIALPNVRASAIVHTPVHGARIAVVAPNQSINWFGYNQGTLEQKSLGRGATMFHAITGDWNVPKVSQHKRGEAEYSATWAGIGGGCVDAQCNVGDNTLIQAGTEQDVGARGRTSYTAWWEVIPAPSVTIPKMTIAPGDHIHLDIHETVTGSEVWSINLADVTRGETFTKTVPYSSSYATAEWIEETPLIIGTNGGFAALPNLTEAVFDNGTTNGASPGLVASEEIQLVSAKSGKVYAVPSAPDSDTNGFGDCAWATSCSTPSS